MAIDIHTFLSTVAAFTRDKNVPVVDLIAVQTNDPYKILVATILSARTKDETTAAAAARLFNEAETIDQLAEVPLERLEKLIHPVGFFRNKAKYLASLPAALKPFNYQVPETIDELLTLPGVGRKTANLVRSVAFNKPAICVDTHVHRIMNIWQYVDTQTPLQTEMALREKLPEQYWLQINSLLVAFGQALCKPVRPHCDQCPLTTDCPKTNVVPRKRPVSQATRVIISPQTLKCISWNVNGIRAIEKKGFSTLAAELNADILALQEIKAMPEQLPESLLHLKGYQAFWHSAEKKGYSGVAVYTRKEPLSVVSGIGNIEYDREGRVITLEYETFYFINIYFPNAGEGLKRLDYKISFNRQLHAYAANLRSIKPVILCGDFNVAHKPIDLKNPDRNSQNAGYTPQERQWMDEFLEDNFVDTFRLFNQEPEQYSWWSYRFNARARNIGWRIDYFCTGSESENRVADANILQSIHGSDHCPVSLDYLV